MKLLKVIACAAFIAGIATACKKPAPPAPAKTEAKAFAKADAKAPAKAEKKAPAKDATK